MKNLEARKIGPVIAFEGERLAKQVSEGIGRATKTVGHSLDEAVEHMCEGIKGKVLEYTRKDPFNALLIALGTGILLGWLTKEGEPLKQASKAQTYLAGADRQAVSWVKGFQGGLSC